MFFLKRVCSYCGESVGTIPTPIEPKPGLDTSHGVCGDCLLKYHPEAATKKLEEGGEEGER